MLRSLILFVFALYSVGATAHPRKYWVIFKDKGQANTAASLDRPLYSPYVSALKKEQLPIICQSKWLNAVSTIMEPQDSARLLSYPFIAQIRPLNQHLQLMRSHIASPPGLEKDQYAFNQMHGQAFADKGLNGTGVRIGVIDAGYIDANVKPSLKTIFEHQHVMATKDFISPWKADLYQSPETFQDWHGTEVLECIGGIFEKGKQQKGFAPNANYYLARTDHGNQEYRGEEDYWVQALEWLDSMNVRLVNSSLGYAKGFDDPAENYRPADMDGQTSMISKVAEIATTKKGMYLVVSAGNEGDDPTWRVVSAPADAEHVLSVGATEYAYGNKFEYSAQGPQQLDYIKPDIACYASSGTSFSAPIITGLVACMLQYKPQLTNEQITAIIQKSSNLHQFPNNFIGYGVPNCRRILDMMNDKGSLFPNKLLVAEEKTITLPIQHEEALIFQKKDERNVVSQSIKKVKRKGLTLKRMQGISRTTVVTPDEVYEVKWAAL